MFSPSALGIQFKVCVCVSSAPEALSVVGGEGEAAGGADSSVDALGGTVAQPVSSHRLPAELGSQLRNLKLNA